MPVSFSWLLDCLNKVSMRANLLPGMAASSLNFDNTAQLRDRHAKAADLLHVCDKT